MGVTPSLAARLQLLSDALGGPPGLLEEALRDFGDAVRAAVSSYIGMTVTGRGPTARLGFTLWHDGERPASVRASLKLPLPGRGGIGIVLYAANPGAFVDLAADLAVLTGRPLAEVAVDEHLHGVEDAATESTLLDASALDQAVGVLLGSGWTPEQALRALDERGRRRSSDGPAAARELLSDLERGVVGWWAEPP